MGRDATVSWGGPEFVFQNDLKNAILIKVRYTTATFTVTFYGTKQGRRVESRTTSRRTTRSPSSSTPSTRARPRTRCGAPPPAAPAST